MGFVAHTSVSSNSFDLWTLPSLVGVSLDGSTFWGGHFCTSDILVGFLTSFPDLFSHSSVHKILQMLGTSFRTCVK